MKGVCCDRNWMGGILRVIILFITGMSKILCGPDQKSCILALLIIAIFLCICYAVIFHSENGVSSTDLQGAVLNPRDARVFD